MALDKTFSASLIDGAGPTWAPKRILGVRVRKFSLWHITVLKTLQSPYMCQGLAGWNDLRIAVGVCRLGYRDSRIRKPYLVPTLIWIWAMIRIVLKPHNPFRRSKDTPGPPNALKRALQKANDAFLEYSGDYIQRPEYAIRPPENAPTSLPRGRAPDEIEHAGDLMNYLHCSLAQAWEMPFGEATWYRALSQRAQGQDVDFVDEAEKKFQETVPDSFKLSNFKRPVNTEPKNASRRSNVRPR